MSNLNLNQQDDLFFLQVRLFRLAQIKWSVDSKKCSEIFNKYKIYDYIEICYEENLNDINNYLKNNGVEL